LDAKRGTVLVCVWAYLNHILDTCLENSNYKSLFLFLYFLLAGSSLYGNCYGISSFLLFSFFLFYTYHHFLAQWYFYVIKQTIDKKKKKDSIVLHIKNWQKKLKESSILMCKTCLIFSHFIIHRTINLANFLPQFLKSLYLVKFTHLTLVSFNLVLKSFVVFILIFFILFIFHNIMCLGCWRLFWD
jgi:hypothetical protein